MTRPLCLPCNYPALTGGMKKTRRGISVEAAENPHRHRMPAGAAYCADKNPVSADRARNDVFDIAFCIDLRV
ncbi:MAG: hypothetical protein ACRYGL_06960 [Janthinobacterium lividum]